MAKRTTVLQYADDTILFLGRSNDLKVRLHKCLLIFSLILGLHINLRKSSLIGVGLDQVEVQHIASSLGCQIETLPMKYLGLQLGGRGRDVKSWNRVLELFSSRLMSWQSRYLSMGGKGDNDQISVEFFFYLLDVG